MKYISLVIFASLLSISCFGQEIIPGEWIVQFSSDIKAEKFAKNTDANDLTLLSKSEHIFLLRYKDHKSIQKSASQAASGVLHFQANMKLETRDDPDDPQFIDQWNLPRIGVTDVWNLTTGGKVVQGKEIVVAVMDEGFDMNHEDIAGNVWENADEIPNNGIDDDNNGYVDDVFGANMVTNDGNHALASHGMGVAGIIGAKGDNGIGIAGINWDIKVMYISGLATIAEIIESYAYVIDQRTKFNNSNGEEGAFVVATNLSLGVPNIFGVDSPLWCNLYDQLGNLGVLNVGATDNPVIDVGVSGDLPSTCESEHLIIVTNSDRFDELDGAYNSTFVDVSAPGEVPSLSTNNEYRTFNGTSGATPHVSAIVALLYSIDCEDLYNNSLENPAQSSLFIRDAILNNVESLSSLQQRTKTGGIVNVLKALNEMVGLCGEVDISPLSITAIGESSRSNIVFDYTTDIFTEHTISLYDMSGKLIVKDVFQPPVFGSKRVNLTLNNKVTSDQWPGGVYVLTLENENDHVSTKLFLAN